MPGGVFICYRREESAFAARAIHDRVVQRLERENVFLDVDNIDLGVDWFTVLSERVGACDALVAVIGRNWVSSADRDNRRRIDDPEDFVRIEIEAALKRNVRVIPVLVDGAAMPKAIELPDSLKGLARRQGIEISPARFEADVERLTSALGSILDQRRARDAAEAAEQVAEARRQVEAQAARRSKVANDESRLFSGTGAIEPPSAPRPPPVRNYSRIVAVAIAIGIAAVFAILIATFPSLPWKFSAHPGDKVAEQAPADKIAVDKAAAEKTAADKAAADMAATQPEPTPIAQSQPTTPDGQYEMGNNYYRGVDYLHAAYWYRKAADQGHSGAQYILGTLYDDGKGVAKDSVQAKFWYQKAASQGHELAATALGRIDGQ